MTATCTVCRQIIRPSLILNPKYGVQVPKGAALTDFARLYFATLEHFGAAHPKEVAALQELALVWMMWSYSMLVESTDKQFLADRQRAQETLKNLVAPDSDLRTDLETEVDRPR